MNCAGASISNNITCALSEDSNRPACPCSLIRDFLVRLVTLWSLIYAQSALQNSAEAQLIRVFAGHSCILVENGMLRLSCEFTLWLEDKAVLSKYKCS